MEQRDHHIVEVEDSKSHSEFPYVLPFPFMPSPPSDTGLDKRSGGNSQCSITSISHSLSSLLIVPRHIVTLLHTNKFYNMILDAKHGRHIRTMIRTVLPTVSYGCHYCHSDPSIENVVDDDYGLDGIFWPEWQLPLSYRSGCGR